MSLKFSSPVTMEDIPQLLSLRNMLVGRTIESVYYAVNPAYAWTDEATGGEIHQTDTVILQLSSAGALTCRWAPPTEIEGLELGTDWPFESDRAVEVINASELRGWRARIGARIQGIRVAWQEYGPDLPPALWAVTLTFCDADPVTFVLGEEWDGVMRYVADTTGVMFNRVQVESFRPGPREDSAWGQALIGDA